MRSLGWSGFASCQRLSSLHRQSKASPRTDSKSSSPPVLFLLLIILFNILVKRLFRTLQCNGVPCSIFEPAGLTRHTTFQPRNPESESMKHGVALLRWQFSNLSNSSSAASLCKVVIVRAATVFVPRTIIDCTPYAPGGPGGLPEELSIRFWYSLVRRGRRRQELTA